MDAIDRMVHTMTGKLGEAVPLVVGAILVLLIGYVLANLIRKGLAGLLGRSKTIQKLNAKDEKALPIHEMVARLVYYLLMLYVLILALEVMNVTEVLEPVKAMFARILLAVPDVVAGILIGFVGYVLARMISEPVRVLCAPLDKYSKKLGFSESFVLSRLLGQLVFLAILLPVLVAALHALKIEAISVPATGMIESLLAAVPLILAAAVILLVAYAVGSFVTSILQELLANLGLDGLPAKLGLGSWFSESWKLSRVVAKVVLFFIMIAALVSALEKLGMAEVSLAVNGLMVFLGQVALGLVILAVGALIAKGVYGALVACKCGGGLANLARFAIVGLVLAMGLKAMGIADRIVELAFGLTLGSLAVAVALAFGLGGREAAGRHLEYLLAKLRKTE
ncbi:MAG: mechanosensitive ion channel [Lentisphaeria bacterium]|jgi:hypothetical protein|nr:mechanosensitive ion channel [Lentisphaeria bacterium]